MVGAHHFCRALIHFPVAPRSIHLASFSASAASHECCLSSTFSALISSSSHQSPSGLTAATSDLSVHASLSYSLPLFPAHSSLCLSQSISLLLVNRQPPPHWHQQGLGQWCWGGGGGVYTRKAFCSPAISRRGRRMSGRLEMPPHLIYCTQGMTTTPPYEVIFIKRNTSSALFSHVDLCLGKNWNYQEDSQGF